MSFDDWKAWLLALVYGGDEIDGDDYVAPLGWHESDELGGES